MSLFNPRRMDNTSGKLDFDLDHSSLCRASMRSGASQAHEDAWRDKNPQTKHDR